MSEAEQKDLTKAYKRMICGAVIGAVVFTVPLAVYFWVTGEFEKVPMYTMPPGLILMLVGSVGMFVGALASLLSRNWATR